MNKKLCVHSGAMRKTRQTHVSGGQIGGSTNEASCQKCGRKFVPKRKWQIYCSTKCRKLAWFKKLAKVEILNDHEARLQAIERKLRIKKGT